MTDYDISHRFIFDDSDIRGEIVTLQQSYCDCVKHQSLTPVQRMLLGQFLSAVTLVGETLKFDGLLTLQARGNGTIPLIMAEVTHTGELRGIVKTQSGTHSSTTLRTPENFNEAIGNGILTFTVDPTRGERYQGIVPIEHHSLADCLTDYFQQSEQITTRLWIFADATRCGGLLLQNLPAQKISDQSLRQEKWLQTTTLTSTITEQEFFHLSHSEILFRLFNETECRMLSGRSIAFKCSCTRERSANALIALGKDNAFQLVSETGTIQIQCEFCGNQFEFDKFDLFKMFGNDDKSVH